MLSGSVILLVALFYLGLLFAIARYGDQRADAGRSIIATPYVYALSIAVYCTTWTFFGSVGRAVSSGIGFLPIYLGPTLAFVLGWVVIRKIIRISKANGITSIADFIASRYGKSFELGILVSIIAVVGILPYISLQLKAISTSYSILAGYPKVAMPAEPAAVLILGDTELFVSLVMAAFAILFGTRHIDASERHEGMVAAIAFESVVKLAAFFAVGVFVTYGLHAGFSDIFARAEATAALNRLFTINGVAAQINWVTLTLLAMAAIVVLPRQFQVLVVENVDERHLKKAMWLFPLYLFLINIFVLPIAFAGLMRFPDGGVEADTFVFTIANEGGPAAPGTARLHRWAIGRDRHDHCRDRGACHHGLQRSGHAAPAARWPASRLGTPRPDRNRAGNPAWHDHRGPTAWLRLCSDDRPFLCAGDDRVGLVCGSAAIRAGDPGGNLLEGRHQSRCARSTFRWLHRLDLYAALALVLALGLVRPQLCRPWSVRDWLAQTLRPLGAGGPGPDLTRHDLDHDHQCGPADWCLPYSSQSMIERSQAVAFVDVFKQAAGQGREWRGRATIGDLSSLLARFLGGSLADAALTRFEADSKRPLDKNVPADSDFVAFVERQLAGAMGAASARIMVASVLREEMHSIDEVTRMLDEASQLVAYSHRLEQKSRELEAATSELKAANMRLQEVDKLKDDFMATVSHEIRTPLTSIRSFGEILRDNPDLDPAQRQEFITIIVHESERLSRLINDILDLAKMEAGTTDWAIATTVPCRSSSRRCRRPRVARKIAQHQTRGGHGARLALRSASIRIG